MSNLSELSIQLRKLQSTNNTQTAEIDRLNRQIRILSDLQGVSLHDIKDALRTACESEAHEALRAEVGRLKAQLECFSHTAKNESDLKSVVKTQEEFNAETASRARTNLELRVGELEELEGTLRNELAVVYERAHQLTAKNTELETQYVQQQNVVVEWERRWNEREEDDIRKGSIVERQSGASLGSYNYSDIVSNGANNNGRNSLLLTNEPQTAHDLQHRLLAAETALEGEKQKNILLNQQLESRQNSYDLKLMQNQHRIQFIEGQILDLEQQLSSLYAAFGIVQQERIEERDQKLWLKRNLLESDAALAKEAEGKERCSGCPVSADSGSYSLGSYSISNPFESSSPPTTAPQKHVKPTITPPVPTSKIAQGYLLVALQEHDSPKSKHSRSPFSPRKLLSKSKSPSGVPSPPAVSAPKFTRQYCTLHGSNGLYQLRYGNSLQGGIRGVHEFITTGVSSVEHTARSATTNYGFEIAINPDDANSPSLCCAAENEEDFMMWMTALTGVIDGSINDRFDP